MAQAYPILYSFRRCPYAMRARLALVHNAIAVELREVVLKHKPAAMLAVSPKGTVPVLQLVTGQVIEQSLEIMYWAFNQTESAQLQHWTGRNDGYFKPALDAYKYPERYQLIPNSAEHLNYRQQAEQFFQQLEQLLSKTKMLLGETVSLLDYAIFPFIRQFAGVEPEWFWQQPYPHLLSWLQYHLDSAIFATVMQRFEPWEPVQTPIIFAGQ